MMDPLLISFHEYQYKNKDTLCVTLQHGTKLSNMEMWSGKQLFGQM